MRWRSFVSMTHLQNLHGVRMCSGSCNVYWDTMGVLHSMYSSGRCWPARFIPKISTALAIMQMTHHTTLPLPVSLHWPIIACILLMMWWVMPSRNRKCEQNSYCSSDRVYDKDTFILADMDEMTSPFIVEAYGSMRTLTLFQENMHNPYFGLLYWCQLIGYWLSWRNQF